MGNGGIIMQQNLNQNHTEIISMEEYLSKRQAIREKEQNKQEKKMHSQKEKSPAFLLTELYV